MFRRVSGFTCGSAVASRMFSTTRVQMEKWYQDSHEWVEVHDDNTATIGVSNYAQETLGDVVYVGLPTVGDEVDAKTVLAEIESVKATSDLYSPIHGKVASVNEKLKDEAALINSSPEEDGWIAKLSGVDRATLNTDALMNEAAYKKFLEDSQQ